MGPSIKTGDRRHEGRIALALRTNDDCIKVFCPIFHSDIVVLAFLTGIRYGFDLAESERPLLRVLVLDSALDACGI